MALLGQILLFLTAAGVGFAVAWLVWRRRSSQRWTRAEREWQGKLAAVEKNLDSAGVEHGALEDALAITFEELASLKPEGANLRTRFREFEAAMATANVTPAQMLMNITEFRWRGPTSFR